MPDMGCDLGVVHDVLIPAMARLLASGCGDTDWEHSSDVVADWEDSEDSIGKALSYPPRGLAAGDPM